MFTYVYISFGLGALSKRDIYIIQLLVAHYGFAKGGNNPRSEFGFSKAKGKMPALTTPGLTKLFWF